MRLGNLTMLAANQPVAPANCKTAVMFRSTDLQEKPGAGDFCDIPKGWDQKYPVFYARLSQLNRLKRVQLPTDVMKAEMAMLQKYWGTQDGDCEDFVAVTKKAASGKPLTPEEAVFAEILKADQTGMHAMDKRIIAQSLYRRSKGAGNDQLAQFTRHFNLQAYNEVMAEIEKRRWPKSPFMRSLAALQRRAGNLVVHLNRNLP